MRMLYRDSRIRCPALGVHDIGIDKICLALADSIGFVYCLDYDRTFVSVIKFQFFMPVLGDGEMTEIPLMHGVGKVVSDTVNGFYSIFILNKRKFHCKFVLFENRDKR